MNISLKQAVTGLALITAFGSTHAQSMQQGQQDQRSAPPGMQQQQQSGESVADAKVEKFAEAEQSVREIQQEFRQELQNTDDQEKARQVQVEMQQEMRSAVEDTGLDASEYNKIAQLAMQDQKLRERIEGAK